MNMALPSNQQREMLFISHANPEDNMFTRWLALQLGRCGYPVWCDLTRLLGGEAFWTDIEKALRQRTLKFVYVLSRTSNSKDGPLNELQVASNVARDNALHDFIIPLAIDDLPSRQTHIQLSRLNHVSFRHSWADGLRVLLELLEREKIQKDERRFGAKAVSDWWRSFSPVDQGVRQENETHVSNWFPARKLPEDLHLHQVSGWPHGEKEGALDTKCPASRFGHYIISFAPTQDFESAFSIERTASFPTAELVDRGIEDAPIDRKEAKNLVMYLLRDGWLRMLKARQMQAYELASGAICHWFRMGDIEDDTIKVKGAKGQAASRQVVGYSTVSATKEGLKTKRFWHFAFQAKPYLYPFIGFALKPHVLFSDDGASLWESKERLHKARRRNCRSWWNPKWRDLILASASHLAADDGLVHVPLASDVEIQIEIFPVQFESLASFDDPEKPTAADEGRGIVDDEATDEDGSQDDDDEPIDKVI